MIRSAFFLLALISSDPLSPKEQALLQQISDSGRGATLAESTDSRVAHQRTIAPGPPPLVSFRYYEGKLHHRFGNGELMLDDAGH
jgi:hypothetical protein